MDPRPLLLSRRRRLLEIIRTGDRARRALADLDLEIAEADVMDRRAERHPRLLSLVLDPPFMGLDPRNPADANR